MPVVWEPFLLGPIFAQQGWNDSPFNVYPAKGRYMWRDLERLCEGYGIPFARPSRFPRDGLLAARVACCLAKSEPWLPEFVRAVFRANFAEDREIGDAAEIREILDPRTAGRAARGAGPGTREQDAPARTDAARPGSSDLRRPELRGRRRALLGERPPGGRPGVGNFPDA